MIVNNCSAIIFRSSYCNRAYLAYAKFMIDFAVDLFLDFLRQNISLGLNRLK